MPGLPGATGSEFTRVIKFSLLLLCSFQITVTFFFFKGRICSYSCPRKHKHRMQWVSGCPLPWASLSVRGLPLEEVR